MTTCIHADDAYSFVILTRMLREKLLLDGEIPEQKILRVFEQTDTDATLFKRIVNAMIVSGVACREEDVLRIAQGRGVQ